MEPPLEFLLMARAAINEAIISIEELSADRDFWRKQYYDFGNRSDAAGSLRKDEGE